jgi:hypothetical protein
MIKRTFLALALSAGLLSPAYAAGTIPLSLSQRLDNSSHLPLSGGKLYFIQAGTVAAPQNAYQDSALTIPWANPLTLDAGGNIPQLFFADGQIKIRLTNSAGVNQLTADNIQVIGASSGGGGGGSVDPTTILSTGDIKVKYGTGVLTGFVRLNGRTIGSASSGATERANADAQVLFEYFWNADSTLVVSTGRGASSLADWTANKTIAVPDMRGKVMAGLDDMGNSAAGAFTGVGFASGNATTLGSKVGIVTQTIQQSALPNVGIGVTASGSASVTSSQQYIQTQAGLTALNTINAGSGGSIYTGVPSNVAGFTNVSSTGSASVSGATASINGNVTQTVLPTIQPTTLITVYAKL